MNIYERSYQGRSILNPHQIKNVSLDFIERIYVKPEKEILHKILRKLLLNNDNCNHTLENSNTFIMLTGGTFSAIQHCLKIYEVYNQCNLSGVIFIVLIYTDMSHKWQLNNYWQSNSPI